jgi:hypothetical protein
MRDFACFDKHLCLCGWHWLVMAFKFLLAMGLGLVMGLLNACIFSTQVLAWLWRSFLYA